MAQHRWVLQHWNTAVELDLERDPRRCGEGRSCSVEWLRRRLAEWLRRDGDARKLHELDARLGGTRPLRPDPWSLRAYEDELIRRICDSVAFGRVQVVVREPEVHGGGGRREEEALAPEPAAAPEDTALSLVVRTISGDAAEDDAGFLLVGPDGRAEKVKLEGGRFERASSLAGAYRARFRYLRGAAWTPTAIRCGEEVELAVQARGFDDGEEVRFEIRDRWHPHDGEPIATLTARVASGAASARWRHALPLGGSVRSEYVFAATLGAKYAESIPLVVTPAPTSTYAGVKHLLGQLGYECGAPGPEKTSELEQALRKFQERCGFATPSGRCDDATLAMLEALT